MHTRDPAAPHALTLAPGAGPSLSTHLAGEQQPEQALGQRLAALNSTGQLGLRQGGWADRR